MLELGVAFTLTVVPASKAELNVIVVVIPLDTILLPMRVELRKKLTSSAVDAW